MFDAGCIITYAVNMHNAINDDQLLWRAEKTWVFSKVTCSDRGCRAVRKFVLIRKKQQRTEVGFCSFSTEIKHHFDCAAGLNVLRNGI